MELLDKRLPEGRLSFGMKKSGQLEAVNEDEKEDSWFVNQDENSLSDLSCAQNNQ